MTVRLIRNGDCVEIAQLHRENIGSGFLSRSEGLLELIYRTMVASDVAFCFVGEEDSKIVGFISGAINTGHFYREFIKKNLVKGSLLLLPKVRGGGFIRKAFETLCYPTRRKGELPAAELLSIAVAGGYQNRGIGRELFGTLRGEFRKRGVECFRVTVGSKLSSACRFYEKMGGFLQSGIEVHKGEESRIYTWQV